MSKPGIHAESRSSNPRERHRSNEAGEWWCPTCGWNWIIGEGDFDGTHYDDVRDAPCPDKAIPPERWAGHTLSP